MSYQTIFESYFPFWNDLSQSDRELLCCSASIQRFERLEAIHGNEGCSGLYIVKSGKLRLYILSEEGKEVTLYRLSPGEMCMLSTCCVINSITFDVFLDAEMPSECYKIDSSVFSEISQRVPSVKIFALEAAVQRFSDVFWVIQQILFMSMDKRLAVFLLYEVNSTGSDTVTLTHETIAKHLGTAREVVSRTLRHMANDGILELTRKEIRILDKNKLRELS